VKGKMSFDYTKAIHTSRHTLWKIWLHILNAIKTRGSSSREKEENELMMCVLCLLLSQIMLKTWWRILLHQYFKGLSTYAHWRHKELCESWWWLKNDQQGLGHDEPYIGEEQVEDLTLRYQMWWRRGKWMFEFEISIMPWKLTKL
jgi:hypothetical protein